MGWFGGGAKTYEMPPGANVTPGIFKNDAFKGLVSGLEKCVGYIDATLVLDEEPYTLHHTRIIELGYSRWSVEVVGKSCEAMDRIVQALISTIGGRRESKELDDGKVQIVVTPTSRDVDLSAILDAINLYASRTKGTAIVSGYKFKDLSEKLADQVRGAGLPLQEVKETKS